MRSWKKKNYSRFNQFQDQHRQRRAQRLALPRGLPLPLHLRERPGPLLLAAARLSRRSARRLHQSRPQARIPHRKRLRPQLHRQLRPPDQLHRLLASPATPHPAPNCQRRRLSQHPPLQVLNRICRASIEGQTSAIAAMDTLRPGMRTGNFAPCRAGGSPETTSPTLHSFRRSLLPQQG